jgi:hypothetical protein
MPGFSGLKSGLVSTCSGTSLHPTFGISSHCLRTDRANCSSWFLRLSVKSRLKIDELIRHHFSTRDSVYKKILIGPDYFTSTHKHPIFFFILPELFFGAEKYVKKRMGILEIIPAICPIINRILVIQDDKA